jgi:hypothetical protein
MTAPTTPADLKQCRASVLSGSASAPYGVTLTDWLCTETLLPQCKAAFTGRGLRCPCPPRLTVCGDLCSKTEAS